MSNTKEIIASQVVGGIVNEVNVHRIDVLNQALASINVEKISGLAQQDANFINALNEVKKVEEFLADPSHILGSEATKHGEIAESIEVNIGNAKQVIKGLDKRFSSEGVGRTAPEDYIMDGVKTQSKFINGPKGSLKAVLEHLDKYKDINFGRDGSVYVIPHDQYETIMAIKGGQGIPSLKLSTQESLMKLVDNIEKETGRKFEDVVKSSISDYKDVQQGKVEVLDNHKAELDKENQEIKMTIKERAENKKNEAISASGPSMSEALKTSAISALLEGSTQSLLMIYKKKKKLSEYSADDWKDVGLEFGKGSTKGGVRAFTIYSLTNYAKMPAPLASSYVAATFGVLDLYKQYKNGALTNEEFLEQSEILALDTSINILASSMGQLLIPIPVLGAVIGSIAGNVLSQIIKKVADKHEKELMKQAEIRYKNYMASLNAELYDRIEKIMRQLMFLHGLSRMAFDFKANANLRFEASKKLAYAYGVNNNKILKSKGEIDDYFKK
jgi:hypothetical protein